jgi:folate-dependent phosphoribosylglycinamide formyltransferase PurN
VKIAMLISGGGTTMSAIINACKSGRLKNVEPVLVISSHPEAGGIQKALDLGISEKKYCCCQSKRFSNARRIWPENY